MRLSTEERTAARITPRSKPSTYAAVFDNGVNEVGELVIRVRPARGPPKDVVFGGYRESIGGHSLGGQILVV